MVRVIYEKVTGKSTGHRLVKEAIGGFDKAIAKLEQGSALLAAEREKHGAEMAELVIRMKLAEEAKTRSDTVAAGLRELVSA